MKRRNAWTAIGVLVIGAGLLGACTDQLIAITEDDATAYGEPFAADARSVLSQQSEVRWSSDISPVTGAYADLLRRRSGMRFRLHTLGLPPGDTFTIWWVIFNYPEECENPMGDLAMCTEPDLFNDRTAPAVLYGAGHVVGGSGRATFAGSLRTGDLSGCQEPFAGFGLCGDGLVNPEGAEVHLVVRSHGHRLPGLVSDQIRTFAGGCTPETSFGAGTGPNECADLQFAIITAP